ncbi:MAG: hypothetical protein F6K32_15255 [Desertifilum sp. SIO1I2]|nr:hypothetical protein [Desertifilum sp. SIO1I2]
MSQTHQSNWTSSLLAFVLLLGGASAIAGGVWLAIQLTIDPDAALWINQFLPEAVQLSVKRRDSPQTFVEIQSSIAQLGLIPGSPIPIASEFGEDILIPVQQKRLGCQQACEWISQLRVYRRVEAPRHRSNQPPQAYYELMHQVAVQSLEESFVVAPLLTSDAVEPASNRPLGMNAIRLDKLPPTAAQSNLIPAEDLGVWFQLTGTLNKADRAIAYGQMLYYNPSKAHLAMMLSFTSPAGELPTWEGLTGDSLPELAVNQTVGLEPQLRVYQLKPRSFVNAPLQLEEITLTTPALNDVDYRKAITLARGGLWTSALEQLEALQERLDWTEAAQAQKELIRAHAQLSQAQADKSWASPSQQVLTSIIDGRWQAALEVFASSIANRREIALMLKADSGRLKRRVEAALDATPQVAEVKVWGALIRAAQEGRGSAQAWLQQRFPNLGAARAPIEELLAQVDIALSAIASPDISRIVGTVRPVENVQAADWLYPEQNTAILLIQDRAIAPELPPLSADQVWYQVEVSAFHNGETWLKAPFNSAQLASGSAQVMPDLLWQQLGLSVDSQLQITFWTATAQQETQIATVKAIQFNNGNLRLLAAGSPPPPLSPEKALLGVGTEAALVPRPLAMTAAALQWLEPQISTIANRVQTRPQWTADVMAILWRELHLTGEVPSQVPMPSLSALVNSPTNEPSLEEQLGPLVGGWLVQWIDLTGDGQLEAVLTLPPESFQALRQLTGGGGLTRESRTLIFSDRGELLYSELTRDRDRSLVAIAELGDGGTAGLLVEDAQQYRLQRWSSERRQFD